jgi:hypothetical protein
MTNLEQAKSILDPEHIVPSIHFSDSIDETQKQEIRQFIADQAAKIGEGMTDIEDDDDAGYYLAVKYVECKASWIQMNLQLNYQTVLRGEKDEYMFNKAAAVAGFLGQIEPVISTTDIELINGMLLEKMRC